MYLLYLDGSGSVKSKEENYFILAGIAVFDRQIYWLIKELDELVESFKLSDPGQIELHGSPMLQGREEPWRSIDSKDRAGLVIKVLDVLAHTYKSTRAFGVAVHKASLYGQDPVEYAFEEICNRFDLFLTRLYRQGDSQRGLVIMDDTHYDDKLRALSRQFRSAGTRWRELKNIPEVPFFADSTASRLIQLADFVAFGMRRRYELSDGRFFDPIVSRFDRDAGVIHGLVHFKPPNEACFCPACLSREKPK